MRGGGELDVEDMEDQWQGRTRYRTDGQPTGESEVNELLQTLCDARSCVLKLVAVLANDGQVAGGDRTKGGRGSCDGEVKDFVVTENDTARTGGMLVGVLEVPKAPFDLLVIHVH